MAHCWPESRRSNDVVRGHCIGQSASDTLTRIQFPPHRQPIRTVVGDAPMPAPANLYAVLPISGLGQTQSGVPTVFEIAGIPNGNDTSMDGTQIEGEGELQEMVEEQEELQK